MLTDNVIPFADLPRTRRSDPRHIGWLERFSNEPGSEASSAGAYLTGIYYEGKHDRSRRLLGLDASNSKAEERAIVIHGTWYVSPFMVRDHAMLGRSQGCLAVAQDDLDTVLSALLSGSLIFVDKVKATQGQDSLSIFAIRRAASQPSGAL